MTLPPLVSYSWRQRYWSYIEGRYIEGREFEIVRLKIEYSNQTQQAFQYPLVKRAKK